MTRLTISLILTTLCMGTTFMQGKKSPKRMSTTLIQGEKSPKLTVFPEKVDFFTSMGWVDKSNPTLLEWLLGHFGRDKFLAFKDLYDKNTFIGKKQQGKAVIPKIIHQIWVGPNTPPAIFKDSQESMKRLHPEWEYKLWTDADIPGFKLYNQEFYDAAKNYGAKADILRYEILSRYGGVYLDIDFVCIRPLDVLLQYDAWATNAGGDFANGAIGAVPGHPILEDTILSLKDSWNAHKEAGDVIDSVGPRHLERSFMKFVGNKDMNIIVFPTDFFYPLLPRDKDEGLEAQLTGNKTVMKKFIKPETFAIHFWAGSWWVDSKADKFVLFKN